MARPRNNSRNKKSRKRRNRNRRRRPRVRGAPQQSTGLGRAIATGVKSLVSTIPGIGTFLGTISDFAFKSIGITSTDLSSGVTIADASMFALEANICISVAALVMGSKVCVPNPTPDQKQVIVNFREVRCLELTIEVIPNNPMQKRAGELMLSFQPFFDTEDRNNPAYNKDVLIPEAMKKQYLNTSGPADRILSVTYRPRPCDGFAYQFRPLWDAKSNFDLLGQCCIYYRNVARDTQAEFTGSEFHCQTVVSGKFETRGAPGTSKYIILDRAVQDTLTTVGAYLIAPDGVYIAKNDDKYSCKSNGMKCRITGNFVKQKQTPGDVCDYEMV